MPALKPRSRLAIAVAIFVAAIVLCAVGYVNMLGWPSVQWRNPGTAGFVRDVAAAISFGIAGIVAMTRRPENPIGPLMIVVGVALIAWWWTFVPVPLLTTFGFWLSGAAVIVLGIVVLAYPTGRLIGRAARVWAGLAAATLFGVHLALTLTTPLGVWECPDCRSLITLTYQEPVRATIRSLEAWLLLILAATLVPVIAARWLGASRPARRAMASVWVAGLLFSIAAFSDAVLVNTVIAYDDFSEIPGPGRFLRLEAPQLIWGMMPWVQSVSLVIVPIGIAWGIVQSRLSQSAVSALAVELRRPSDRQPLVESLRRALGDRTLDLGLWSRPAGAYVTPDGQPMDLSGRDPMRAVTSVDGDGGPLAVMIHDPALSDQSQLVEGVAAVAQLSLENERLHAEVRAQLEEVRASRERLVAVADAERRRIERNLHDGAQQRLVSVCLALNLAQARAAGVAPDVAAALGETTVELRGAIAELRELARGIHPAILSEAGLGPALESLAEHTPMSVAVTADLDGVRLPEVVEGTAYFVTAEALTNVARHAGASSAAVDATTRDGWLHLRISDDGRGGADPARGSGLRGLVDRVAAVGGHLRIGERAGGGTTLEADIPCA